jgi:hypothetical protein
MGRKLLRGTIKITWVCWLLRQENHEFKTSLGHLLRHCLKLTEKKRVKGILANRILMKTVRVIRHQLGDGGE